MSPAQQAPLIKICGLTNLDDARKSIAAGANWLGFIFVPGTPRVLSLEQARPILTQLQQEAPNIRKVGVFQNASPADIETHLNQLPLDAIQLHGQENPADYAHLQRPLIKVILLQPSVSVAELHQACQTTLSCPNVEAILLDLPKGSGLKSLLDWPHLAHLPEILAEFPCLIAGGLTPENITTVLKSLSPLGVDVASGVEQSPGRKNLDKLQAFCQQIQTFYPPKPIGEQYPCSP